MRICAQNVCVNQNNGVKSNNQSYLRYFNTLDKDTFTPSFTGLKKSMFNGINFAVVEKFKSPIEKFHSLEDFEAWSGEQYYNLCMKDFGGRTGAVKHKRQDMICDWDQALSNNNYTNAEKLLIMNGITKDLGQKDENICPAFNRQILSKTLKELKTELEQDKKLQFDFGKMYRKNLVDMYTKHSSAGANESKWIILPSKDNDPIHFKENVEKLQSISTHEMCTKFTGAEFHLSNGDIHVYMENGKPKVLLRLNEGVVQEINGEHNDYRIPKECVELTKKYLYENELVTTEKADEMLKKSMLETPDEKLTETNQLYNKKDTFWGFLKKLFNK